MSHESTQLEHIYGRLEKYKSETAGDFKQFMSTLEHGFCQARGKSFLYYWR